MDSKNAAPAGGELVELLKEVEHELTTLHGLVATDRPDLDHIPEEYAIHIDVKDLREKVSAAIKELGGS